MDETFFELIIDKKSKMPEMVKWNQKIENFFDGFTYLNSEDLIYQHVNKLSHVGINSLTQSSEMIRQTTKTNLDLIDNELKKVINNIHELSNTFNEIESALNQKVGFFSKKSPGELFFEFFQKEQSQIKQKINDLNVKQHSLIESKKELEDNIDKLMYFYIYLEKDIILLKKADEILNKNGKSLVKKIYNENAFEIISIQTDLLTQQQILFQKYGALKILHQNIMNCHKNIGYLTRITGSCLLNLVELQQIINLSNMGNEDKSKNSLMKVKELIMMVTKDLKEISTNPFKKVIEI
jgi:hypothetical protein